MPRRKKNQGRTNGETLRLRSETRRSVIVVFLFTIGAFILLSEFELAGSVGEIVKNGLAALFGSTRVLVAIALIAAGLSLFNAGGRPHISPKFFGTILGFLALQGLLHLTYAEWQIPGSGGGYLGFAVGFPFAQLAGPWAALLILSAIVVAAALVATNSSLSRLIGFLRPLFAALALIRLRSHQKEKKAEELDDAREPASAAPAPAPNPEFQTRTLGIPQDQTSVLPRTIPKIKRGNLPPLDLLDAKTSKPNAGDIRANQLIIERTLEQFGIPVEMGAVSVGPTITQYTLKPSEGIKLARITALSNDLALSLAAHPIRIEAPIPGKALVGIEVPNKTIATVRLRELLDTQSFVERKMQLPMALGKDVAGTPWIVDLGKMPHLLVAGATGSGKTVSLNSIIISLLYANTAADLRFIMVDPKRVELPVYNKIPHLLTPVVTDIPKTISAFKWAIREMERRFELLSKLGCRDIGSWNRVAEEKLPYIAIIVDELADLMVAAASAIEPSIIRLAQMSRAVGIHLILATQRPSVDVLTGLIKANITSRVAFAVASAIDSRTILDTSGAEKLLGRGDMLYVSAELSKPKRLQGAFVAEEEIQRVVDFYAREGEPVFVNEITNREPLESGSMDAFEGEGDPLIPEAIHVIVRAGKASASLLQRRLKVGYARAARLLDLLEEQRIIGPGEGAKPREILIAPHAAATMGADDNEEYPEERL
ncbi:MAG: DNA translocase FtsK 4TM domain-containing protein [Patescibacteria group bacterium]